VEKAVAVVVVEVVVVVVVGGRRGSGEAEELGREMERVNERLNN
jgi:hypothetical protein